MINAEKFKKEIRAMTDESTTFAFKADDPTVIRKCNEVDCHECLFNYGKCFLERMRWIFSEYKEPIKLSRLEYEILERALNRKKVRYIVRDSDNGLMTYGHKPDKGQDCWNISLPYLQLALFNDLFQFVQWEDEEPTSIQEVLNNCEVVENETKPIINGNQKHN